MKVAAKAVHRPRFKLEKRRFVKIGLGIGLGVATLLLGFFMVWLISRP